MYKPPTAHASVTSLALLSPPHRAIAAFCPLKWHQVQTLFCFFPSTISRTKNKSQPCEKSAQATALNFHRDTNVCVLCEPLKKHIKRKTFRNIYLRWWGLKLQRSRWQPQPRVTAAASVWQVTYTRRGHDESPDFGLSNCDATKSQLVELARMQRLDKKGIFGIVQFYRAKYKKIINYSGGGLHIETEKRNCWRSRAVCVSCERLDDATQLFNIEISNWVNTLRVDKHS